MPYEPRKKSNPGLKILICTILAICVFVFAFSFFNTEEEVEELYQIANLSVEQTKEVLEKKAKDTYTIEDYFYYGESLSLLKSKYNPEVSDDMYGKSVILKDVCSDNEMAFVVGTTIDSAIQLNHLEEGFYEIYIMEDLIEKKAVFNEDVVSTMKTTLQNGKRYEVTLLASSEYFKERKIQVKENYAYLQVKEVKLAKNEYDIAIDPAALDRDFNIWSVNLGSEGNGLKEYEETYVAAELLKKAFEDKGYKVLIVRDKEEEKNSYGEDGRLKEAYDANCKYYFRLSFAEDTFGYNGFDIAYSAHSSNMLASQIIYHMQRNSDISISTLYSGNKNKGVYKCILLEGMDNREVYDSDLWIRESGGKATQAGKYSENAKEGTSFFAMDNVHGMHALNINLGYISNSVDANHWKTHKDVYMKELANAIISYINVGS